MDPVMNEIAPGDYLRGLFNKRRRHSIYFDVLVKICNIILLGRKERVSPYVF